MRGGEVRRAWRTAAPKILLPAITLASTLALVQIMIHSSQNAAQLPGMMLMIARVLGRRTGPVWPMLAPLVGALGSFMTGSNTVSNIMFSGFQYDIAIQAGLAPALILGLQAAGGAAGNMVCIHNVVAVSAVVGLRGGEGDIIRRTAIPMLMYAAAAGALGMLLIWLGFT
jgi:lactate permease